MATTYPYAAKGAPTVGKGLGGLPRRIDPVIPAPVVAPTPVPAYYLSKIGQMYNTNQTFCYSPNVGASGSFSDGSYSNNTYYVIRNNTFTYFERTYQDTTRQIKTTGGNATTWVINDNPSYWTWIHCLKHDLSGMCSLQGPNTYVQNYANTSCVETVNGVDTYYFMTWDTGTMSLSKVTPNYAAQTVQQAADLQVSFTVSQSSRSRVYAMFVSGNFLYVLGPDVVGSSTMMLDKYDKSTLAYVSTNYWTISAYGEQIQSLGFVAETATTIAVRYQVAQSAGYARVFVLDKTTLKGYDFSMSIGGDSSWQCSLLSDMNDIYVVFGSGSGGGSGSAQVYMLRSDRYIQVGYQSYSGATFSLASSVRCTTPRGFNWGSYFRADGVGGQNTNFRQIWIPSPTQTFAYSNNGWYFAQAWSENPVTPTSGTATTNTPSTTSNPYTAQFWSFNPLGTTYITA